MHFIYNIGIQLYGFALRIASLFNPKAKDWVHGRTNFFENLPSVKNREVVWFHCASLGEFDQGLPLMNLIKTTNPEVFLLVTFFSPSGYNHYNKRHHQIDYACYLPLDTPKNSLRFVNHFAPIRTFFIKYEFWSNYIFSLKKHGSKIYSISTILRSNHRFFKWYGSFFRNTLKQFDFFFVQNQETQNLLSSIGIKNTLVSGDTRFDRVIENKKNLLKNEVVKRFVGNDNSVFICGSTWPVDEKIILPIVNTGRFNKVIIAPHNVDQSHIDEIAFKLNTKHLRISENPTNEQLEDASVLILDTIGQLTNAYQYGHFAYIGGGFSGSLHNILEPAVFGLPVMFGPKHSRFPEAQAFIENGFGFEVADEKSLKSHLEFIQENHLELAGKAIEFVEQNAGAAQKIVSKL